mgnify:CR=1 FL=1
MYAILINNNNEIIKKLIINVFDKKKCFKISLKLKKKKKGIKKIKFKIKKDFKVVEYTIKNIIIERFEENLTFSVFNLSVE